MRTRFETIYIYFGTYGTYGTICQLITWWSHKSRSTVQTPTNKLVLNQGCYVWLFETTVTLTTKNTLSHYSFSHYIFFSYILLKCRLYGNHYFECVLFWNYEVYANNKNSFGNLGFSSMRLKSMWPWYKYFWKIFKCTITMELACSIIYTLMYNTCTFV